jgi:geranylgeranyl pyrophosphate synthase
VLRYGIELGCAFQIVDDIIDLTSDPSTTGKPSCNDIRRGILTLPLILGMDGPAGSLLQRAFSERNVTDESIRAIRAAAADSGCIDQARDNARALALSAEARLSVLPPSPARAALASMARGVIDRRS